MRSIHRRVLVTAIAVLALGAIASASASAAEWHVGGKALTGSAALAKTTKVEESIGLSILEGYGRISCPSATLAEVPKGLGIFAPNTLKMGMVLEGCKMTAPSNCSVVSTIVTEPLVGTLTAGTYPEDKLVLTSQGGKSMFTLSIDGSCSIAGEDSASGSFTLSVPTGQEELAEQAFLAQGSKEKPAGAGMLGDPLYLSGKVKLKLSAGSLWSFR
jgi:hypothetical protein